MDDGPGRPPLVVARLRRPWGRRGELLADLETDWPEQRFAPGALVTLRYPDGRVEPRRLRGHRQTGSGLLLAFEGVCDIDGAEPLAGALVTVPADALPEMAAGDVHVQQLIGLVVESTDGAVVGEVRDVVEGRGQDRLIVALAAGGTADVPFVPAICVRVDPAGGRIVVDPPAGLIDPDGAATARPGSP